MNEEIERKLYYITNHSNAFEGYTSIQWAILSAVSKYIRQMEELDDGERHAGWESDFILNDLYEDIGIIFKYFISSDIKELSSTKQIEIDDIKKGNL